MIVSAAEPKCFLCLAAAHETGPSVKGFGIDSCCNENSGRKQRVNKCRVVRSWTYGLQHDSFSRQRYLDFLMAKNQKAFSLT